MEQSKKEDKILTDSERAEIYIKELEALDKKHGFTKIFVPAYKARDDGTFSLVLQPQIAQLPKES